VKFEAILGESQDVRHRKEPTMSDERNKGDQHVDAQTPELTTELSGKDLEDVVGGWVYTPQKRADGTAGGNTNGAWDLTANKAKA
jgi:hypothetical protein